MITIKCNLFGSVKITEGDTQVFIPTGKVSELYYYLAVKKITRREELVGLLWPDTQEENGKNSLRNTLHKLKKYFQADLFSTPNKSLIILNEAIHFELDLDLFRQDPLNNLSLYTGDFLAGITVKNCFEFDCWLTETREHYRILFINNAQIKIAQLYEQTSFEAMETLIQQILLVDEFNETAFWFLMKYYKTLGRYDKIINEYYHLQKILEDELGIEPTEEIERLFQEALSAVRIKEVGQSGTAGDPEDVFFYRTYEYNQIQEVLAQFETGGTPCSILLKGESGAGKSTLKKKIKAAHLDQFTFLEVQCSLIERVISYSPWMRVINQMEMELDKQHLKRPPHWKSVKNNLVFDLKKENYPTPQILETSENFNADLIFKSIHNALGILGAHKKVVIILEDIQWLDQYSVRLLVNLILNNTENALFLLTTSDEAGDSFENLNILVELNKLAVISLKRFNKVEVTGILKKFFKTKKITPQIADDIYEKSRGNAFFLKIYIDVYLHNTDEKLIFKIMQNVLKEKFTGFNQTSIKILRAIAVYNGDIKVEFLLEQLDLKAFELIDAINDLVRFNILEEKRDDTGLKINFIHESYRDYIYEELSETTKLIMHREIAQALEQKLSSRGDIQSYLTLRYHYELANDKVKRLKYEGIILYYHLNFSHELFPSMDDFELTNQTKLKLNNESALNWIHEVEVELQKVINLKGGDQNSDIEKIELLFFYCKGRYLIRCGNYQEGIRMIRRVIVLSERSGDLKSELQGHKQMIIYGIQTNNPEIMLLHITNGIKVARKFNNVLESGVLYRLYGVYHLMQGRGETAEALFMKSISLVGATDRITNTNSINLAANYNYIGEIRNQAGAFDEAMDYFNKAIHMCDYFEPSALSIFYINAGKTAFLMNNGPQMAWYLDKAAIALDQFDSFWKKPVLEALRALHAFQLNDFETALKHLKRSVDCVNTINNPRDIGMVYFAQAMVRKGLETDPRINLPDMTEFLSKPSGIYFFEALKHLDPYRDRAEIEYLRKLM